MGVLPLQSPDGESVASPATNCSRSTASSSSTRGPTPRRLRVQAGDKMFEAVVRIDTRREADYYRHGGILQFVLRQLAAAR